MRLNVMTQEVFMTDMSDTSSYGFFNVFFIRKDKNTDLKAGKPGFEAEAAQREPDRIDAGTGYAGCIDDPSTPYDPAA